MFTGIVEDTGKVSHITDKILILNTKLDEIKIGDSVSISGVCLTAVKILGQEITFDVSPETLEKSSLSGLKKGTLVNLERALTLKSRLGGHIVSGHIENTGKVLKIERINDSYIFTFSLPNELTKYIVTKGSIAIDGISLTVAQIKGQSFSVSVIPHTFKNTTFGTKKPGDLVNLETDMLAKYVENMLNNKKSSLSESFLKENGFV
jgi:riboflavin synthase